jgi:hypothetical protein
MRRNDLKLSSMNTGMPAGTRMDGTFLFRKLVQRDRIRPAIASRDTYGLMRPVWRPTMNVSHSST